MISSIVMTSARVKDAGHWSSKADWKHYCVYMSPLFLVKQMVFILVQCLQVKKIYICQELRVVEHPSTAAVSRAWCDNSCNTGLTVNFLSKTTSKMCIKHEDHNGFLQSWLECSVEKQVSMRTFIILLAFVALSLSQKKCSYNCDGWPYEQCRMSSGGASATCINPFSSRSSSQIYSNYPTCADVPSGCQRCDDVCSSRDGNKDKLDYRANSPRRNPSRSKPAPPRFQPGPSSSQVCDYQCKSNGGCTATYVGPSRPGKHAGSCFPDDFGGSCSGTPNECQNCNQVLSCSPEEIKKSESDTRSSGGR